MAAHRILFYDIETAPAIAYVWRADTDYVSMDMMIETPFLINWGAKWAGESKVHSAVVTPEEALARDDRRIVDELASLIRTADVTVAHNGDRFDMPVLNGRILKHNLEPLGPARTIDTLTLARKAFALPYNKLDFLGEYLGLGRKIKTDIDLWKGCVAGDLKCLKEMQKYNKQDVVLLERVFDALKPYVRNLPRLYDADRENMTACPSCGGEEFIIRGYYRTQAGTFAKMQCKNCLRYSRQRTSEKLKKLGPYPL